MKVAAVVFAMLAMSAQAASVTPIEKVVQMLGDLETKILGEGKDAQKVYDEYSEFCEDRSRNVGFEIKTGKSEVSELQATIEKESATAASLTAKIEDLASAISVDEADLKSATEIRTKEQAAFEAEEKELLEVINTLERAISIVKKEMAKGGASMMQLKSAANVAQALTIMVDAASLNSESAAKLNAFLQNSQEDEDVGAPAAAVYSSHSGGIVGTLQDLFEKAESQLEKARSTETKNVQAYQMLVQSLKDEIKYGTKDMDKAKKDLAASGEAKATAEGDLDVTSKDLAEDVKTLATLHSDCMKAAEDFEAETKSRGEELKALATAKKVIMETTSGAADLSYSLLQVSRLSSAADLANFEAVRFVRDLAQKQKSPALAQLAAKMAQLMRAKTQDGEDPFGKVKGLIRTMIEKLLKEGEADATEKAFCDKEMAETEEKKADKEAAIEKLSTKIDSMSAKSARLKEEVAELEKELAALAKTQAEMDKLRSEEKAAFEANSAEMEQGVEGVKMALKVLTEYYAKEDKSHESADGAGEGIIGLLEVVESDFTKGLAEMTAAESSAAAEYDKLTKENEISKAMKMQDVKYKTKDSKGLDKDIAEASADRATVQEELDAVLEYYKGIKARCVAKAESYAERTERRAAEIAGLKEALSILDGESVLLQQTAKRTLRAQKFLKA
jgi:DNA repair exonuclease SbcCD ATPase subunit|mmetsp:Transcript_13907/g.22167  ORF Transcript_13907/g.22167 Transcript_13907/m.22167 type:complete len:676 (+) Transcript_13907:72-2099(+)